VSVEVRAKRAAEVIVTVGSKGLAERVELERSGTVDGIPQWSGEVHEEHEEECQPVTVVAKNEDGRDTRDEQVCAFGPTEEPQTPTLPPIG
jgi:hypothetical protein